jgi:hypothetical protein
MASRHEKDAEENGKGYFQGKNEGLEMDSPVTHNIQLR